jgi:hypothetical protein
MRSFLNDTLQDDQLLECRLTLQVDPQLYSHIDAKELFNLTPDLRHPSKVRSPIWEDG